MSDEAEEHIKRLEGMVAQYGAYLHDSSPRSRVDWSAIGTIIALIITGITVAQSWAVIGKRVDDLEESKRRVEAKLDKVTELAIDITRIKEDIASIKSQGTTNNITIGEIRDDLMSMGLLNSPLKPRDRDTRLPKPNG